MEEQLCSFSYPIIFAHFSRSENDLYYYFNACYQLEKKHCMSIFRNVIQISYLIDTKVEF